MKKCLKCGFENKDNAINCASCNNDLVPKSLKFVNKLHSGISVMVFVSILVTIFLPWGRLLTEQLSLWNILSSTISMGPGIILKSITEGSKYVMTNFEVFLVYGFIGSCFFIAFIVFSAFMNGATFIRAIKESKFWSPWPFLIPSLGLFYVYLLGIGVLNSIYGLTILDVGFYIFGLAILVQIIIDVISILAGFILNK